MVDAYALVGPLVRALPPERAHRIAIRALRLGLAPRTAGPDPILKVTRFGLEFPNPIGLAAGFDKNAEVFEEFPGVGFVEVGTVTPLPQRGNPKPRLFRLPEDLAVINRLGFNNDGMERVAARLVQRSRQRIVGVNLGCNRESGDPVNDYVLGLRTLGPCADYVAVNVSSPNTPGLRALQKPAKLEALLRALLEARAEIHDGPGSLPILVKIAPDLDASELDVIVGVAVDLGVDGMIVGNTTLSRLPTLRSLNRDQGGGLSGEPLRELATSVLRTVARSTAGRLTLVGVGGISSGLDAYARIRAGAALVELYTGLIYHGPALIERIHTDLAGALRRDGFTSLEAAIGVDV